MRFIAANSIGSRDGTLDKDELVRNAVVEPGGDGFVVLKRPAMNQDYSLSAGASSASTQGQIMFLRTVPGSAAALDPVVSFCAIRGDTLYTDVTA